MDDPITTAPSAEFLALQQVLAGRYSIERELGRGGMGIVLLARDVALDRPVAIKLLPPALAATAEYRDRFLREARTAAGLSHPNIVPIHLVEQHDDIVFFVMGYVDGETLRERVERSGPLSPRTAARLMQDVAFALAYAHQRGVIHRDIKPDNVMIESDGERALVTDFGIAIGGRHGGDDTGVAGTARYMSPEQALGEPVDGRSDLYSLGATLFYALTGRPPFDGNSLPAILAQQVTEPVPEVRAERPEVPANLAAVVERCLPRQPADRFASADELARAVDAVRGRSLRAPPAVRNFLRNAEITTMVMVAMMFAGRAATTGRSVSIDVSGIVGIALVSQLFFIARRLLREGYTFGDIREAVLAEAEVQAEEAEATHKRRLMRRLESLWHKLWAGRFGRWFFAMAGIGLTVTRPRVVPTQDATELVLGQSALAAYRALPVGTRQLAGEAPAIIGRLEDRAEGLRARGVTGERLSETVAALENIRLAMLRLRAGSGSVDDLTLWLDRARAIGERVDHRIEAAREVKAALEP